MNIIKETFEDIKKIIIRNRERITATIMLVAIMAILLSLIFVFSGCDNKKTAGLEGFKIETLPIKCQLYILSVDAIKNNDGGGLVKNKTAEKNFTLASFFAQPCLKSIDEMESKEKEKLIDEIIKLKIENKELKMKVEYLQKEISKK